MPKTKRNKIVNLTKTKSNKKSSKNQHFQLLNDQLSSSSTLIVFLPKSPRNHFLSPLRQSLKPGHLFIGRNKLIKLVLGKSNQDEIQPGTHLLSKYIKGNCGLISTNQSIDEIKQLVKQQEEITLIKSGQIVPKTISLSQGPLVTSSGEAIQPSIELQLRKLGMPTKLNKGVVELYKDYVVCNQGDICTPEQAQILKHLGLNLSKFELILVAYWNNGKVHELETLPQEQEEPVDDAIQLNDDDLIMQDEDEPKTSKKGKIGPGQFKLKSKKISRKVKMKK